MTIVPRDTVDKIQFYIDHIPVWEDVATQIGTTVLEVTSLNTKTQAAKAAYDAQQAAQDAAKSATETLHQAVAAMAAAGSTIIEEIRAKASAVGPSIYPLAQIPAPATPSPTPPPSKPSDLVVTLDDSGTINLKWKCANPARTSGTMYQLFRRTSASGEFQYIGGTGKKSFADNTLPAGSTAVTYQIQAVRSTSVGPSAQFNVNFGIGGGTMTASVVETAPTRIAA